MAKLRWPHSLHSQVQAVFSSIRAIGVSKAECPQGHIRSIGTAQAYLREAHNLAEFLKSKGVTDLRDAASVQKEVVQYLAEHLAHAKNTGQSLQTQESRAAALSGLERAFNQFFTQRDLPDRLNFAQSRQEYLELSRAYLSHGREYVNGTRAYHNPELLVAAIKNETHSLQATLQYQTGLRAEGAGAPAGRVPNPITPANMKGTTYDPVTGKRVGLLEVREKGGKWTVHYVPQSTFLRLGSYLEKHGKLESRYTEYRASILNAAKATGQFAPGRGTHGLKTSFAQRRYLECVKHGFSHEKALQQTALELAHNRADITLVYTRG